MHIVSHRTCGSSPPCTRHPIHACALVRCVVVVSLHPSPFFYFVPLLFFRPFQMSSSEVHERLRSNPLCDFRLGTVATSDHETPLTCSGECLFGKNVSSSLCAVGEKALAKYGIEISTHLTALDAQRWVLGHPLPWCTLRERTPPCPAAMEHSA